MDQDESPEMGTGKEGIFLHFRRVIFSYLSVMSEYCEQVDPLRNSEDNIKVGSLLLFFQSRGLSVM